MKDKIKEIQNNLLELEIKHEKYNNNNISKKDYSRFLSNEIDAVKGNIIDDYTDEIDNNKKEINELLKLKNKIINNLKLEKEDINYLEKIRLTIEF